MIDTNIDFILENDRSRLEPLDSSHAKHLEHVFVDHPDLMKFSPNGIRDPDTLKKYIQRALASRTSGVRYPFAIYDKKLGQYAGSTSFGNIANAHQRVEIGWTWIGKSFQRTGLNRNNKFLMLQYLFDKCEYERVELKTDNRNEQSKNAMLKIGATAEGILRSHTLMDDGFRRDTIYFSLLRQEWPQIRATIFKDY